MELENTLLACLSSDKQLRGKAEAAVGQLQKNPAGSVQLFQLMQTSQREEVRVVAPLLNQKDKFSPTTPHTDTHPHTNKRQLWGSCRKIPQAPCSCSSSCRPPSARRCIPAPSSLKLHNRHPTGYS